MALSIYERYPDANASTNKKVCWPLDDYVWHMVLRQGRMINKSNEPCVVEALDFSSSDGRVLVFHMTPLEASLISEQYPEFLTTGLVGRWKMNATTGLLKLLNTVLYITANDIKAFLTDPASNVFVRQRYVNNFETTTS